MIRLFLTFLGCPKVLGVKLLQTPERTSYFTLDTENLIFYIAIITEVY